MIPLRISSFIICWLNKPITCYLTKILAFYWLSFDKETYDWSILAANRKFRNSKFWHPLQTGINGFIITWILHQIIKNSSKVKLAADQIKIPNIHFICPIPSFPTKWKKWLISDVHASNLNWLQFFLCQNIHLYSVSILILVYLSYFQLYNHT